jgi:FtsP/CotA-like multicopper oxidase with cupredoxin domain
MAYSERMRSVIALASVTVVAILAVSGCASHRVRPPAVPAPLRPPSDQAAFLEVHATGVQIYECASKPDAPGAFAWIFQAPEATLTGRRGHPIGRHYAGPTWELHDGSRVAGEVVARDPGPDPTAIPWLLLKAKSASATGRLSRTQSILRIYTVGGVAPSASCTEALAHTLVRVPYSARYYFFR